ncbi:IclR family transcriptional regulator [Enterovibrio sp. ZSDZ42]|uniref:IclR family transcriptional regulator n=1 Tax=Enterovibrio gelatinilyticus TaxID=2899819 RepID=A0ABT5QZV2_9GAMM|nr:IclR family transcriptional regulator [Enterovibrio sp. ZSDZ42]MDD1793440.1 IclR family transcriptional regulator [Enterovibrio sp. ZSDZ42]
MENRLFVGSVKKAFEIIEAFDVRTQSMSLTELVQVTGMGKSAVQRYVYTLEELGYLTKSPTSKRYELSLKMLLPASSYLSQNNLVSAINPHIINLRQNLDARVGVSVYHQEKVVYLIPLQSITEAYPNDYPGFTVPIYCTSSGRIFLSTFDDNKVDSILEKEAKKPFTPLTITNEEDIKNEVQKFKQNGYCITNQEISHGKINISVPILNYDKEIIACIVAIFKTSEWDDKRLIKKVFPIIQEVASFIRIPSR